jgi:osmotically-inducible protein OsmY
MPACRKNPPRLGLDVDVYLHPESASLNDAILEAAIRKRLHESQVTQAATIQVQVIQRVVFLSGNVDTQPISDAAAVLAQSTEAIVNGESIKTVEPVHNRLTVK